MEDEQRRLLRENRHVGLELEAMKGGTQKGRGNLHLGDVLNPHAGLLEEIKRKLEKT